MIEHARAAQIDPLQACPAAEEIAITGSAMDALAHFGDQLTTMRAALVDAGWWSGQ